MDFEEYNRLKSAKDRLNKSLDAIAEKYNSDQYTIDCTKMSQEDSDLYISIDFSIERIKEVMNKYYLFI